VAELYGQNAIQRLRMIARPVAFATGLPKYPVSVAGSAFLVGYRQGIFVLTAKHVIAGCPVSRVLVFPCEGSNTPMPFPESWHIEDSENDSDRSDLMLMRIELSGLAPKDRARARVVDLNRQSIFDWWEARFNSTFFIFGYPALFNRVNYDTSHLESAQVFLRGNYAEPGIVDGCHQALFANPHGLDDFNGLSGSPVFCTLNQMPGKPEASPTFFCGIAIRGGASSGLIHFLGTEVIRDALDEVIDQMRMKKRKTGRA
jgi:hypothetical protein